MRVPAATVPGRTMSGDGTSREAGSESEFAALVREHQSMVFSIALHFLHDRESAEEVAQDVFLQLYRQRDRLEGPGHVTAWLRRVACNRSIDYARSRHPERSISMEEIGEPASATAPDDPMLREKLRKLILSLGEKARMVMILRYQEDLDPEEIARELEMPVSTVKSHLQRSLAVLRAKFGRALGEKLG